MLLSNAIMQLCNYAVIQLGNYAIMQLCNYTIEFPDPLISWNGGNHNYAIMQLRK